MNKVITGTNRSRSTEQTRQATFEGFRAVRIWCSARCLGEFRALQQRIKAAEVGRHAKSGAYDLKDCAACYALGAG